MYIGKYGLYEFYFKFVWILCDCFFNEKDKNKIKCKNNI